MVGPYIFTVLINTGASERDDFLPLREMLVHGFDAYCPHVEWDVLTYTRVGVMADDALQKVHPAPQPLNPQTSSPWTAEALHSKL